MAKETNNRASRPNEDNPEWTAEDFAKARPASEMLPRFIGAQATQELMRRGRRPQSRDKAKDGRSDSGHVPHRRRGG
jgi:hypothetical protein